MTLPIPPGAAALSGKTWRERKRPAAYMPPSGAANRVQFEYTDVGRDTPLRTAEFRFPGINNSYIQQNGFGSRVYPMRCYFTGDQCDLIATAFENMLCEPGQGKLEHPLYGTISVVPVGTIARRDNLREEANQSVVEISFWTSTGAVYPAALKDPQNEILKALDGFDLKAAQQFNASVNISSIGKKANLLATVKKGIAQVGAALGEISSGVTSVRQGFADLTSTINFGLDVLVGEPLQLALQVSNLIKAPGRALVGIESRLDAYADLATRIFGSEAGNPETTLSIGQGLSERTAKVTNDFHVADLFATAAVAGMINAAAADPIGPTTPTGAFAGQARASTGGKTFLARPDAVAAAIQILDTFDRAVAWRDAGFTALAGIDDVSATQIDTGEAYQALHDAAAMTAGFLIQASFSLAPEKSITLDRNRTIIDLCAELYGTVDSQLDFLIQTNNLVGDEILELPVGKTILYYPQAA